MFPILPILILLLMGPANAERLAVEGRLPAALLAVHRSMVVPVRVSVEAPVTEEPPTSPTPQIGTPPRVTRTVPILPLPIALGGFAPGWPTRAGPSVA